MKPYLKLVFATIGLAATARVLLAADATPSYSVQTTNSYPVPNYSRSISLASSSSSAAVVALNAQALLLTEMLQEHQKRAADLSQKNQNDKANWETEFVAELQDKSARLHKSIVEMTRPGSATNDVKAAGSDVDDQLAFMSALQARLQQIQEELSAAAEQTGALTRQVATKTTAEEIAAFSSSLGDNQRLIKELLRERFDLELRKLEFRAIQKAVRK